MKKHICGENDILDSQGLIPIDAYSLFQEEEITAFMAWVQVFNYACIILLFWTNFIPGFGNVSSLCIMGITVLFRKGTPTPNNCTPLFSEKYWKGQANR